MYGATGAGPLPGPSRGSCWPGRVMRAPRRRGSVRTGRGGSGKRGTRQGYRDSTMCLGRRTNSIQTPGLPNSVRERHGPGRLSGDRSLGNLRISWSLPANASLPPRLFPGRGNSLLPARPDPGSPREGPSVRQLICSPGEAPGLGASPRPDHAVAIVRTGGAPSHPPDSDSPAALALLVTVDPLAPPRSLPAVEDHQMALGGSGAVHILARLG